MSAGRDAALMDVGEDIRSAVNAAIGPGFHIRLSKMDFAGLIRARLAAHPANVAQVGELSDAEINRIAGCNGLYRAMTPDDATCKSMVRRYTTDILAAAKKGA